ncbi:hypothetical protein [Croceicoccus sp. BE223]|uniref:hypothetical protein n=1 Tax=Croceicoccus sp. BE223 TaxID=2817716 RepID=UPI0028643721|nr:hypothetical protein [Croceicoccus sp. BE223]MDR7101457.1 hypothetical protein [Croceicoccus sp. BE223]
MRTQIRAYDPETRTVPVTFSHRGKIHRRAVNAVLDDAGAYDRDATRARVAEVAQGVEAKIDAGLI